MTLPQKTRLNTDSFSLIAIISRPKTYHGWTMIRQIFWLWLTVLGLLSTNLPQTHAQVPGQQPGGIPGGQPNGVPGQPGPAQPGIVPRTPTSNRFFRMMPVKIAV